MQEQEQQEETDWREDVSEPKDVFKLQDKETAVITFQDEGRKQTHPDFGTSIVFTVKVMNSDAEKIWYVNARNYDLLGQLKEIGILKGQSVKVSRKGSKKSDTRYNIEKQ